MSNAAPKEIVILSAAKDLLLCIQARMPDTSTRPDEASAKGAVELDDNTSQNALAGQLRHRDEDAMLKDNDTDFPEPDAEAEHTGE